MSAVSRTSLAFVLTAGVVAPQRSHACDVNRAALNCGSAPVQASIDVAYWNAVNTGQYMVTDEYLSCGVAHDYDDPQDIWLVTCAYTGEVELRLVNQQCNMDLFVLNGGCDSQINCREASTDPGLADEVITLDCEQGEIYYLMVERREETSFGSQDCTQLDAIPYTLEIECLEHCADGVDNDADGLADCMDPDCSASPECCDLDGDGYHAMTSVCAGDDCNDDPLARGASIHPGARETLADGVDQDCDGLEDCFEDLDHDGWGSDRVVPSADLACTSGGVATQTGDCDDADAAVSPGRAETPGDGRDNDCDGLERCFVDADGDGAGTAGEDTVPSASVNCDGAGISPSDDDCDDSRRDISPSATEIPVDGVDQDCDGRELCYADADGDGFGGEAATEVLSADGDVACDDAGLSLTADDCDDDDASTNPGADDILDDALDQDCDGELAVTPTGCGCDAAGGAGGVPLGLLALVGLVRRRRAGAVSPDAPCPATGSRVRRHPSRCDR